MSLLEAQDPSTPRERLEGLFRSGDEKLKRALALNPNTPVSLLFTLANNGFANLVVQNAVWELLSFENPGFLQEHPADELRFVEKFTFLTEKFFLFIQTHPDPTVIGWVASNTKCSAEKLARLATHKDAKVREIVAKHKRTSTETLLRLAHDAAPSVRAEAAKRLPPESLSTLYRLGADEELASFSAERQDPTLTREELLSYLELGPFAAYLIAKHPNAPSIEAFTSSQDPLTRASAASSLACTAALLMALSQDSHEQVRAAVAANPNCPTEIIAALLSDPSEEVRAAIASSTKDVEMIEKLSHDLSEKVLLQAAARPELSVASMKRLASHSSYKICDAVSYNPSATSEILEGLLYDQQVGTRHHVADHPNRPEKLFHALWGLGFSRDLSYFSPSLQDPMLSIEALEELCNKSPWLTELVADHPNCSTSLASTLAQHPNTQTRATIAKRSNLSPEIIEALSRDTAHEVLQALAQNPAAPFSLLASSADEAIRGVALSNPNCPREFLWAAIQENNKDILERVLQNPNCPADLLQHIASKAPSEEIAAHPNTPIHILEALSNQKAWQIRSALAKNPASPAALLHKLLRDNDFRRDYRHLLIHNPSCPSEILEELADDYSEDIRRAVAKNPRTPLHLLEKLANDQEFIVRVEIFLNPNVPALAFTLFAEGASVHASFLVANHKSCPPELRARLIKQEGFLDLLSGLLRDLSWELLAALPEMNDPYWRYLLHAKTRSLGGLDQHATGVVDAVQ